MREGQKRINDLQIKVAEHSSISRGRNLADDYGELPGPFSYAWCTSSLRVRACQD